jgi:Glycine zipper 2TM domain
MVVPSSGFVRALGLTAALVALSACTERRTAERADSDLSHDLALAGQVSTPPALKDTVVAPVPQRQPPPATAPRSEPQSPRREVVSQPVRTATTPAPQPASAPVIDRPDSSAMAAASMPAPEPKVVGIGTGIALSSGMRVCTNTNKVGDKLVATVTNAVEGTGGATIPTGSRVVLEVAQVTPGDASNDSSIVFRPTTMYIEGQSYPVTGTIMSTTAPQRAEVPGTGPSDKEKVAGGAVVGAILGQILGHDTKSTVIGAAAGAATGAAVAHAQKNYQICLPEGASLVLTLEAPLFMN